MAEDSSENNRLSARFGPVPAASVRCREAQQESVNRIGSTLTTNGGSLVRNRPAHVRIIPAAEQLIRKGRQQTEGDRFASAGGEDGLVALVPFGRPRRRGGPSARLLLAVRQNPIKRV